MNKVFVSDLTHTAQGIASLSFPLGAAYVAAYAQRAHVGSLDLKVHKIPEQLAAAILEERPRVLGFSCYSWNLELSYKLSVWVKENFPQTTIIFGGPNFPVAADEKTAFLKQRPAIDFFVQNEGEVAFSDLLGRLLSNDFNHSKVKAARGSIENCNYLVGGQLIEGEVKRILDVNELPSPYLSGMLDKFFDLPLAPMLETTRGCPFKCAFCADGLESKNRVVRFAEERVRQELDFIVNKVNKIDELIITDLNFAMYKQDKLTVEYLAEMRKTRGWPIIIKAAAGKNQPDRVIDAVNKLDGSWVIGSAIQSSDDEVLKNIKRSNISSEAYDKFIKHANDHSKNSQSYSEIILALPGDTKEKHFKSLRYAIQSGTNSLRMYQAIMLDGTDMASSGMRSRFDLMTRYRVMVGSAGTYQFGDQNLPIAEYEEIIVGSKDMPFEDYVSCRVMDLFVETFINNALFEEVFAALRAMEIEVFDFLEYFFDHDEYRSPQMNEILDRFIYATRDDLFESREQAEAHVLQPNIISEYGTGGLGINELLEFKAELFLELDDISQSFRQALKGYLDMIGLLDDRVWTYLDQLIEFIVCRKRLIHEDSADMVSSFRFDFKALEKAEFCVDPRVMDQEKEEIHFRFFQSPNQKNHIRNAMALYENHPSKLSRMIYRYNLKTMYRQFDHLQ